MSPGVYNTVYAGSKMKKSKRNGGGAATSLTRVEDLDLTSADDAENPMLTLP